MLAAVARELAARGCATSVLARRAGRAPEGTTGISLDYRDTRAFTAAVRDAGPFDLAVVWIHSTAPEAPLALARVLVEGGRAVRYVHVLGSAAADPSAPDAGQRAALGSLPGLSYEEVILGFVHHGGGSRWLRDPEIAAGVLAAIDAPQPRTIVGTVTPWSARP